MPRISLPLDERDLADLEASGLTPQTIRQAKIRTENGRMVFPFFELDGSVNCYQITKPHNPKVDADGKVRKYECPANVPPRAYFPPMCADSLREGDGPIFGAEGVKKALALAQAGYTAVGLLGVYNWKPKGVETLIDDLKAVNWAGRPIYIAFDFDPKPVTQEYVAGAAHRLAAALQEAGAGTVYNVALPPGPNGEKQGVDDFLVAHGPEAFAALIEQAEPVIPIAKIARITIAVPPLAEPAYHGMIGEFLREVSPHTEATDAAILAHLLPAIGTAMGSGFHIVRGSKQPPRLNNVIVGPTNTGRKGTALSPVEQFMELVDAEWWRSQRRSGLSSGEGLIVAVVIISCLETGRSVANFTSGKERDETSRNRCSFHCRIGSVFVFRFPSLPASTELPDSQIRA